MIIKKLQVGLGKSCTKCSSRKTSFSGCIKIFTHKNVKKKKQKKEETKKLYRKSRIVEIVFDKLQMIWTVCSGTENYVDEDGVFSIKVCVCPAHTH